MRVLIGSDHPPHRRLTVRWLFEPRNLWLGVFWNTVRPNRMLTDEPAFLLVYVSVIPCLPVCFVWRLP